MYTVLNPRGVRQSMKRVPISPRLQSLDGKVIYCISQDRPVFTEEISKRFGEGVPGVKVVYKVKQDWIRQDDHELRDEILQKADALIYGTCMGGGSGMSAVTWLKEIEKRGIPSVYLVGDIYEPDIRLSAEMRGIPALRTVVVSLVGEENVAEGITDKQYSEIVSKIVDALTVPLTKEEKETKDIPAEKPPRIATTGTFEEVQDYFCKQQLTDGLPIVPPTEDKVDEMLKGTSHSPDELVTNTMYPEEHTVMVEQVAIIGAMAGCKSEYMPVLLAIIQTWGGNPMFAQTARSDSTMSVMTVINGPIRNEIDMNLGSNAMGPGNRANATIGRFLRLAIISLGGSLPAINDMSAQGSPIKYGFCFPEHEEKSPWEPFHVTMGFKPEESVVSLFSGGWCHWSFSADLDHLAKAMESFSVSQGVVLMAPGAARLYAGKGMSKEDVEKYIHEHGAGRPFDFRPTWFHLDAPNMNMSGPAGAGRGVKVIVVGGETSQPVAQAWQATPLPSTTSIDKWR